MTQALHDIIMDVCLALSDEGREEALALIERRCPFDPMARPALPNCPCAPLERRPEAVSCWSEDHTVKMRVFARDGFIDRFTGEPLVFPAVLRLLSREFPRAFPFQEFWGLSEIHLAYYQVGACTARSLPKSRGGDAREPNLLTTTMPYVLARSDLTPEEAGWRVTREGFVDEWDGMSTWYVEYVNGHQELRKANFFNLWYNAAKQVLHL
ncbi:MAG: hypothetical protein MUE65_03430 [Methanomassiliicoccales archaeon]|nr:hypothetical protein [Methanomassiliicoccales archaeon]